MSTRPEYHEAEWTLVHAPEGGTVWKASCGDLVWWADASWYHSAPPPVRHVHGDQERGR